MEQPIMQPFDVTNHEREMIINLRKIKNGILRRKLVTLIKNTSEQGVDDLPFL